MLKISSTDNEYRNAALIIITRRCNKRLLNADNEFFLCKYCPILGYLKLKTNEI